MKKMTAGAVESDASSTQVKNWMRFVHSEFILPDGAIDESGAKSALSIKKATPNDRHQSKRSKR